MKVLLTGFEPFGGEAVNPSWEAVRLLRAPEEIEMIKLRVPVVFGEAERCVIESIRRERPDAVICVGQATGRAAVSPERIAVNLRDAAIPDNAGRQPRDEPVIPEGPAAYFSTLPVRAMQRRIESAGVPAAISNTAGTFVCNSLMYAVLHLLSTEMPEVRGGFIHLPCLPEQAERISPKPPSLSLSEIVCALESALEALL